MPKFKSSNATFLVISKQCALFEIFIFFPKIQVWFPRKIVEFLDKQLSNFWTKKIDFSIVWFPRTIKISMELTSKSIYTSFSNIYFLDGPLFRWQTVRDHAKGVRGLHGLSTAKRPVSNRWNDGQSLLFVRQTQFCECVFSKYTWL